MTDMTASPSLAPAIHGDRVSLLRVARRGLQFVFFMVILAWVTTKIASADASFIGRHAGGVLIYTLSILDAYRIARIRYARWSFRDRDAHSHRYRRLQKRQVTTGIFFSYQLKAAHRSLLIGKAVNRKGYSHVRHRRSVPEGQVAGAEARRDAVRHAGVAADRGPGQRRHRHLQRAAGSTARSPSSRPTRERDFEGLAKELGEGLGAGGRRRSSRTPMPSSRFRSAKLEAARDAIVALRPAALRIMGAGDAIEIYKEVGLPDRRRRAAST